MRELELDGIHDDGDHIVLRDPDGEQYTLRIDEALRAAVRRDRPALGLIQSSEATALRPREIQAMLRGGHTAEDISEMASIDIEHVRRYEGPVLAERGFTAERARTFKVDRSGGPTLDAIVTERLAARQALDGLRWDAWRLPDGTWNLELVFRSGGRERDAHWIADMTRQVVTAEDDEARWLSLDDDALDQPVSSGRARLTSLKSSVYDQESDADGASARPRRTAPRSLQRPGREASVEDEHPAGRAPRADAIDEDEIEALNARRGLRPVPASLDEEPTWSTLEEDEQRTAGESDSADSEALREHSAQDRPEEDALPEAFDEDDVDGGEEDLEVTGSSEGEPLVVPGRTLDESLSDSAQDDPPTGGTTAGKDSPAPANDTVDLTPLPGFDDVPAPAAEDQPKKEKKPRSSSKAKRSSIPSWDEIVFGSKHD